MAISLKRTSSIGFDGVKALVYGQSKAGKTTLIGTLQNQIIISAESGLLSLTGTDIPYIEVSSIIELREAFEYVKNSEYESICLDSITEIAEICLSAEKKSAKDGRQAYGNTADTISEEIRKFRDIKGKNVFFISKMEKIQDEQGRILYGPMMPGKALANGLAYHFDLVLALRVEQAEDGSSFRTLMTDTDGLWTAGCRNGYALDRFMAPDLGAIINTVKGVNQ